MAETPVYLFTIECLRADYFDREHLPKFWSRFQEDFTSFSNAYANGIATPLSFPSILGDEHVTGDGSLTTESQSTLAELFEGQSVAIPNNAHLHPARKYDRGFDQFDASPNLTTELPLLQTSGYRNRLLYLMKKVIPGFDASTKPVPYPPASTVAHRVEKQIERNDLEFLWAHFVDPHGPYYPHLLFESEHRFNQDIDWGELNNRFSNDHDISNSEHSLLTRIYKEKIRYTDKHLSELLSRIQDLSMYEDSIIIITADHGNLFGENGAYGHDWDKLPRDELIRVPLVVKFPNNRQSGQTINYPVQHLDLNSTVAEELGIDTHLNAAGSPLMNRTGRTILSKSNVAVRGISSEGDVMHTQQGETIVNGDPDESLIERVQSARIPNVSTDMDDRLVSDEEYEDIQEQLSALGYN